VSRTTSNRSDTGWAAGASAFAAAILFVTGVLQFLQGLVALVADDDFLVRTSDYVFRFDSSTWGWIHLLLGLALVGVGVLIFQGNAFGRGAGIGLAALSIVANFLWLPYYPIWAIILIALGVFIIWGLTTSDLSRLR
jgi:hypothetical protein